MAKEVKCPIHGKPLRLETTGNDVFGYCECDVPRNRHKGRKVYKKLGAATIPVAAKKE